MSDELRLGDDPMSYKIEFEHWRIWQDFWYPGSTGRPLSGDLWKHTKNCGWKPAGHGGKTICRIKRDGKIIATGEAVCSMADNFCYRTGRDIAWTRAIEKCITLLPEIEFELLLSRSEV